MTQGNGFSREQYLEKVRGLMAKAESTTQAEAEAAMGIARKLMDRYGISVADVQALKADAEAEAAKTYSKGRAEGCRKAQGFDRWQSTLACAVGELTDTVPLVSKAYGKGSHAVLSFVGDELDVAVAAAMYAMLQRSVYHLGRQVVGKGWDYRHRSFHAGFAKAIWERATEAKRASEAQFDGTADAETFALVKASKRDWLEGILAEMGVVHRKSRQRSGQFSGDSFLAGKAEGSKADLSVRDKLG